jgi:hypothetical protein
MITAIINGKKELWTDGKGNILERTHPEGTCTICDDARKAENEK